MSIYKYYKGIYKKKDYIEIFSKQDLSFDIKIFSVKVLINSAICSLGERFRDFDISVRDLLSIT